MQFMYIHTHTPERCMADKPPELRKLAEGVLASMNKAGVKVQAVYTAPHQHTMFIVLDANDLNALETALTPMTVWGDGESSQFFNRRRLTRNRNDAAVDYSHLRASTSFGWSGGIVPAGTNSMRSSLSRQAS